MRHIPEVRHHEKEENIHYVDGERQKAPRAACKKRGPEPDSGNRIPHPATGRGA